MSWPLFGVRLGLAGAMLKEVFTTSPFKSSLVTLELDPELLAFVVYDRGSHNLLAEFPQREQAEDFRARLLELNPDNPGLRNELEVIDVSDDPTLALD